MSIMSSTARDRTHGAKITCTLDVINVFDHCDIGCSLNSVGSEGLYPKIDENCNVVT